MERESYRVPALCQASISGMRTLINMERRCLRNILEKIYHVYYESDCNFIMPYSCLLPRQQGKSVPQTDTVIGHPGKEEIEENKPVSIAGVGREDPWFITVGNDTIYRYADEGPTFAPPYANASEYVEEAVKNIHIGEGISYVSFVVNKADLPCYVSIAKSAKNNVFDAELARRMDSTACEIVRNMPYFTPAKLDGKVINFRTIVTVRFK